MDKRTKAGVCLWNGCGWQQVFVNQPNARGADVVFSNSIPGSGSNDNGIATTADGGSIYSGQGLGASFGMLSTSGKFTIDGQIMAQGKVSLSNFAGGMSEGGEYWSTLTVSHRGLFHTHFSYTMGEGVAIDTWETTNGTLTHIGSGLARVGMGALSIAAGGLQFITGIQQGNGANIVAGALNIASGALMMTPLAPFGMVLGALGALTSWFGNLMGSGNQTSVSALVY